MKILGWSVLIVLQIFFAAWLFRHAWLGLRAGKIRHSLAAPALERGEHPARFICVVSLFFFIAALALYGALVRAAAMFLAAQP